MRNNERVSATDSSMSSRLHNDVMMSKNIQFVKRCKYYSHQISGNLYKVQICAKQAHCRSNQRPISPLNLINIISISCLCFAVIWFEQTATDAAVMLPPSGHLLARQRQALVSSIGVESPTQNVFQPVSTNSDHLDQPDQPITSISLNQNNQHSSTRSQSGENKSNNSEPMAKLQQANGIETNALNYLQRYGYMSQPSSTNQETSNNLISEESFSNAIIDFQRFVGLPETGFVDNQTLELMQLPRCGNSDSWQSQQTMQPASTSQASIRKVGQLNRRNLVNSSSIRQLTRRRRYALQGSKWRRQELTYRISQYPTRFSGKKHEVDEQIAKAFGIWSQVAPIDFIVKRDGRVHIDIRFASGDHGDGDAFDGPGNTLAHAYFPQYGGDAHFDDQEYWTIDSYAGTNIFQVAAHELGHSLGLGHSNVREALMAPFYQKYKPNFKLHIDDILAIQALYGEKPAQNDFPIAGSSSTGSPTSSTTTSTTTTTTVAPPSRKSSKYPVFKGRWPTFDDTPNEIPITTASTPTSGGHETGDDEENEIGKQPDLSSTSSSAEADYAPPTDLMPPSAPSYPADLCSDPVIDAITRTEDGNSYVFKGDFYWLLAQDGLARGYPRRIAQDWEGLPGNLDSALTWADGKTFFFKGNKYWRFKNKRRDVGYPKLISSGFSGIPDDIEAAFVWSGNGRTYFFKGTEYWRFDSKADPPVSSEYPRSIKVWLGVPSYINAAFKWENNVTYFFKGNQYYRFNDREFKVESRGRPAFPRSTAEWWFGCVSSNLAQRALSPPATSNLFNDPIESGIDRAQQQQHHIRSNEPGDWSFLAGLEANSRSMGTHISDHGQRQPPFISEEITHSPEESGGNQPQIITVDGPSGAQAKSARQPRRQEDGIRLRPSPNKFEDFGWPMSRPRGGDMGNTLFSSTTTSNGSGLTRANSATSASYHQYNSILSNVLLLSAILIVCSIGCKYDPLIGSNHRRQ